MIYNQVKTKFYEAINKKDRIGFVTATAQLFASGKLKELFQTDERYVKFWRNHILKDQGLEGVRKFDENSMRPAIFGGFIRYLMESRFDIPADDSVMWAVFFSSLAHRAGDNDYDKLAFADLKKQTFLWNI